ncbi:type II toxin-antitoxin system PemK/MazF family toxin [Salinibacterium sp. G-O1]|uniref:type II toxin-antitoxin system PemK/MazF family toxin n=1 Tax=Salinibacterium sp. G-O1 TaxID=3046208 RepID=UPI0024BB6753|nr:type II toxin-antitoxin system PemK/MazF family toxin [Salinibacterium sp. G-O1]MDJ0336022.1 type II toxin-antitoxin system PemK/MazF family toxin [Salinibacterium sp. G-O1]
MVILTGDILWAELGSGRGREQTGRRPVVVVSSNEYLASVDSLLLVVPVTSRDRGWPNHVALTGPTDLQRPSYAMTEQILSVSRDRIVGAAGSINQECLDRMRVYLRDFLDLW